MVIVPFVILLLGDTAMGAPAAGDEGMFEGDMILTEEQKKMVTESLISDAASQAKADQDAEQEKKDLSSGEGLDGKSFAGWHGVAWPGNTLYYDLSELGWWRPFTKRKIRNALEELQEQVGGCVKFKERDHGPRVEVHTHADGCFSAVGNVAPHMEGKVQMLNLGSGCKSDGIIQHEFMHALGFFHMQSRSDRDNYVIIHEKNIRKGQEHNFKKYSSSMIKHFGLPFDYGSLMMYGGTDFTTGGYTIETKDKSKQGLLGQRKGLSAGDIKMIRIAYGCQ